MTKTPANTHDLKVVRVDGDTLTTMCGDGKEHCHTVAHDANVTCDYIVSTVADLKAGTPVRVTTHKFDKNVATAIESGKHIPERRHQA